MKGVAPAALLLGVLAGALALPFAAAPAPAAAQEAVPPEIPTSAFAARSPFSDTPQLSPDGRNIAFALRSDTARSIAWVPADGGEQHDIPIPAGELQWIRWAGNDRLLYSTAIVFFYNGFPLRVGQLHVHDLATGKDTQLGGGRVSSVSDDPLYIDPAGRYLLMAMQESPADWPAVWRFMLDGSDTDGTLVEKRRGVLQWIADETGVLRVGLGFENRKLKVWYRTSAGEDFRVVARIKPGEKDELWDLARLISGTDEGLVLEPGPSGRIALRRFNYATRVVGEVVYENPEWDLSGAEVDEKGNPLAVHFTDDRTRVVWLDPDTAKLQATLQKALGGTDTYIVDRSLDGSRLLVSKGNASDPGAWYVYTPARRELKEFSRLRPELDPATLAPVTAHTFDARDGTKIRAYLTLPRGRDPRNLPLIVMPHGGPFYIRDTMSYDDTVQLLANRGYAVLQPNFRGSSGFGEAFADLGKGEIGRRMQDDLDDAVAWAVGQGVADPRRVCLVGASYGGYAALWGVVRNPEIYRCAASWAGVTDWDDQLKYDSDFFNRSGRKSWREQIKGTDRKFNLDTVSPARSGASLARPVLIAHGQRDSNVPYSQFETMRKALDKSGYKSATYLVLERSGHNFAGPADEQKWFDALVAFLAEHNPAG